MKNLILILDGLGYDQLTYFKPAWLTKMGNTLGFIPLDTLLSYSSGIYQSIYTGQYPDEIGFWTEFTYKDEYLPTWSSWYRLIPGRSLPRQIAYILNQLAMKFHLGTQDNFIPPKLQGWFERIPVCYNRLPPVDIHSSQSLDVVFQLTGKKLDYIHCQDIDKAIFKQCLESSNDLHTLILCITGTDHAGHSIGPFRPAYGEFLAGLDDRIGNLVDALQAASPRLRRVIFSDHGMTPVNRSFDAWAYLEQCGFYLNKDYLAFINSTIISLWYQHDNRDQIVHNLNQSGYGRLLSPEDRCRYHLNFKTKRYGDDYFVANEGIEFIPNFLNLAWKCNAGMHGYLPECSSTRAFLIGINDLLQLPGDVVSLYSILSEMALEE